MNRLLRFVALLLLAVWLPVTKHCMLEAAGILEIASAATDGSGCCVDSRPCDEDNCALAEQNLSSTSTASVKVPAAQLIAAVGFVSAPLTKRRDDPGPTAHFEDFTERPLDWVPSWHFERRTVHPSRAPSFA